MTRTDDSSDSDAGRSGASPLRPSVVASADSVGAHTPRRTPATQGTFNHGHDLGSRLIPVSDIDRRRLYKKLGWPRRRRIVDGRPVPLVPLHPSRLVVPFRSAPVSPPRRREPRSPRTFVSDSKRLARVDRARGRRDPIFPVRLALRAASATTPLRVARRPRGATGHLRFRSPRFLRSRRQYLAPA